MQTQVAFITGASAGIGAALAREYQRQGAHTVLLARRVERIEKLATELSTGSTQSLALVCDVTKENELKVAVDRTLEKFGRIDTVIANAGFGVMGEVEKLSIADYQKQFDTNVFGVIRTFQATVEELKKTKGRLAIVGSVNGFVSFGGGSPYAMSKFAVRALCDGLFYEMQAHGVSVTHIAPGFVKSEIRLVDNKGTFQEGIKDPIPSWLVMDTDKAARQIVSAIQKRKRQRIITGHGKFIVFMQRHFSWFVNWLIGRAGISARRDAKVRAQLAN